MCYDLIVTQVVVQFEAMMSSRRIERLERRRDFERKVREFDGERGYRIRWKYVAIAYLAELAIIVTSLAGQWLLSRRYDHGDLATLALMMMAPITYAIIELCRVPLAIAARTQPSGMIKILAAVGVIMAAGVTVKSLSQLGEQMFHPRLEDVVHARSNLKIAENERDTFGAKIEHADALVAQRENDLRQVEERSKGLTAEMSGVKAPQCQTLKFANKKKGTSSQSVKCTPDPRAAIIQANLTQAGEDRAAIVGKLDAARTARAAFDPSAADRKVTETRTAYREAVMNSQLHSFAAMLFAVDPSEVTEAQVHEFLRLFVFLPAVCASLAATLLACAAVERVRSQTVTLPSDLGLYALGGLAEHLVREATESVLHGAKSDIQTALPRPVPAAPPPPPAANAA